MERTVYCLQCEKNVTTSKDNCPVCAYPLGTSANPNAISNPEPGYVVIPTTEGSLVLAWSSVVIGFILTAVGFIQIMTFEKKIRIDIGDLYLVSLAQTKGMAFIGAGILLMVFACAVFLFSLRKKVA